MIERQLLRKVRQRKLFTTSSGIATVWVDHAGILMEHGFAYTFSFMKLCRNSQVNFLTFFSPCLLRNLTYMYCTCKHKFASLLDLTCISFLEISNFDNKRLLTCSNQFKTIKSSAYQCRI